MPCPVPTAKSRIRPQQPEVIPMSAKGIILPEPPRECEFCHAFVECRPYGPNNEQICYACGQLNLEVTLHKMREYLGIGPVIIPKFLVDHLADATLDN
jgi:hypothetical protein